MNGGLDSFAFKPASVWAFVFVVAKFPKGRPSGQLLIEPSIRAVKHALEVRAVTVL